MRRKNVKTVGIAWYQPDDYERILGVMADADVLPATYDVWLKSAQYVVRSEETNGSTIVKAVISPQSFLDWCRGTLQQPDAAA
ncbi:MAG: hypothetical protein ABIS68_11435 [Casimicrobiaceae bacterium]